MFFGIPSEYLLAGSAAAFSVVVNLIGRKTGVKKRTAELRKDVDAYQKEFKEATKKGDQKELDRLKAREPEMMKGMQEMMMLPLRNMIYVIPLFLVVMWLIEGSFHGFTAHLPIGIHVNEILALKVFEGSTYGPRGFFIFFSIIFGTLIEFVLNKVLKD